MSQTLYKTSPSYNGLICNVNSSAQTMDTSYTTLEFGAYESGNPLYRNSATGILAVQSGFYKLDYDLNYSVAKTWTIQANRNATNLGNHFMTNAAQVTTCYATVIYLAKDDILSLEAKVSATTGNIYLRRCCLTFLGI